MTLDVILWFYIPYMSTSSAVICNDIRHCSLFFANSNAMKNNVNTGFRKKTGTTLTKIVDVSIFEDRKILLNITADLRKS